MSNWHELRYLCSKIDFMRFVIILAFILCTISSYSQEGLGDSTKQIELLLNPTNSVGFKNKPDSVHYVLGLVEKKDSKIDLLIEDYLENKKFNGYRIQIFSSSNNRLEAVKAKSEFLKDFPEIKSYLVYQAPNYKVRVGDFLDRLEANKQLAIVQEMFPTAFLVKGEIEPEVE